MIKPLYLARDVENTGSFTAYCRDIGIESPVPDFHVTAAFSRRPVDWAIDVFKPNLTSFSLPPSNNRSLEYFRPGLLVLVLERDTRLHYRFQRLINAGASYDFYEYRPHITLSTETDVDITIAQPYSGWIMLGPEKRETLQLVE